MQQINSSDRGLSQDPHTYVPSRVQAGRVTQTPVLLRHCSNMHSEIQNKTLQVSQADFVRSVRV